LEIGTIARAHGLNGEVVVDLLSNRTQRLDVGSVLSTPSGALLTVLDSRPFKTRWIVTFDGVEDRNSAERLRGTRLLAQPVSEPESLWIHELVGASVLDQVGRDLGQVVGVLANPASDLLELEGGSLVPLVFVTDHQPGLIRVDIPDGLVE
jgi:16S rRNA processing protein RimM